MKSPALDVVPKELMLRNAIIAMCKPAPHDSLWTMVKAVTGQGSTSATKVCRELDWNPDCRPALNTVHRLTLL